jgi:hypothetical protein
MNPIFNRYGHFTQLNKLQSISELYLFFHEKYRLTVPLDKLSEIEMQSLEQLVQIINKVKDLINEYDLLIEQSQPFEWEILNYIYEIMVFYYDIMGLEFKKLHPIVVPGKFTGLFDYQKKD